MTLGCDNSDGLHDTQNFQDWVQARSRGQVGREGTGGVAVLDIIFSLVLEHSL